MNVDILVSSGGRRLELMDCFRASLTELGLEGRICVVDCSRTAPAFHLADMAWNVPSCTDPDFCPAVLRIARAEGIQIIVPTIDGELGVLARWRGEFQEHGIHVCVSSPEAIDICEDKLATHSWLVRNDFPTVRQASLEEVLADPRSWVFPLMMKPRCGSASQGVRKVRSLSELRAAGEFDSGILVQEIAAGQEYTINLFRDGGGRCLAAVPHKRLEVRGGEVSKAATTRDGRLIELGRSIAETLPGAYGPLNVQCFVSERGDIRVIEINARLGGGYPVAHQAGAHFTTWIIKQALDLPLGDAVEDWQDDLVMLRYDRAVFQTGERIRVAQNAANAVSRV